MIGITHDEILSGNAVTVRLEGPLNGETGPYFEDYVNKLFNKKIYFILLDSKDLDYISSEGIGVLLLIQQKISELNGYLVFFNLRKEMKTFFTILGFDKVFKIGSSRIDAIQIMDRQIELREKSIKGHSDQVVAINLTKEEVNIDKKNLMSDKKVKIINNENHENIHKDTSGIVKKHDSDGSITAVYNNPIIVECKKCKALIRVKGPGEYFCPDCRSVFMAKKDQTLIFDIPE